MELRSNRSRSRTPFSLVKNHEMSYEVANHTEESVTHSFSTRNKTYNGSEEVPVMSPKQKADKYIKKTKQITSDYSSEDGESEITSSKSDIHLDRSHLSTYNSTSNGQSKSALQVYKEAGEYWNKYPKTDYTYSIHSKNRVEVAPGVVAMPNMSRRSLHRTDNLEGSFSTSECNDDLDYEETTIQKSRYVEPKALFKNNNYYSTKSVVKTVSVWKRIFRRITTVFLFIYHLNSSALMWVGRNYYKSVSQILMLDTWLLQRSNQKRQWKSLIALFLLPFILFAGWWMWSSVSHVVQMAYTSVTSPKSKISPEINMAVPLEPLSTYPVEIHEEDIVRKVLERIDYGVDGQQSVIKSLQNELKNLHIRLDDTLENMRLQNIESNAKFSLESSKCCKQYVNIESHILKVLSGLIGSSNENINSEDLSRWLHSLFVAKTDLENQLSDLTRSLQADFKKSLETSAQTIMNDVSKKLSVKFQQQMHTTNGLEVADSEVHRIVKEALAIYDADKTGLVDYALESSGGQVLSTRCTESYNAKTAVLSMFGFPLWYPSNTPRTVITSGVVPGECWAFQGFPGFLVIQLTGYVNISAVSIEHIPHYLMPGGHRDSAPKSFIVSGLRSEKDIDRWELGKYVYDVNGPALQFFPVQNQGPAFNIVELEVNSNHGNLIYTCLYRFRVHGTLLHEPT